MARETDEHDRKVGLRVAAARRAVNMTQDGLADALDISSSQVSRIERGLQKLTPKRARQMAEILGRSQAWLMLSDGAGTEEDIPVIATTVRYDAQVLEAEAATVVLAAMHTLLAEPRFGHSRPALARALGLDPENAIYAILNKRQRVTWGLAQRVASLCGLQTAIELFQGKTAPGSLREFPHLREVVALSTFQDAPEAVQTAVLAVAAVRGDLTVLEWIDVLRGALQIHATTRTA